MSFEEVGDRADAALHLLVQVDEGPAEAARRFPAQHRLSRPHEADESDVLV
jgi:hypothetical protein